MTYSKSNFRCSLIDETNKTNGTNGSSPTMLTVKAQWPFLSPLQVPGQIHESAEWANMPGEDPGHHCPHSRRLLLPRHHDCHQRAQVWRQLHIIDWFMPNFIGEWRKFIKCSQLLRKLRFKKVASFHFPFIKLFYCEYAMVFLA